jgi:flagellar FliL protein
VSQDADKPEAEGATPPAANKKKKLIVIGAAAAAVLLGGGGGAYMMFGGAPAKAEAGHGDKAEGADDEAADEGEGEGGEGGHGGGEKEAPLDVPPLLVNLRTADGAPHFLKVHVMLVPGAKSSMEKLKESLPVLLDAYQPFLRELRPEDLSGSAAVFRIKEELLIRSRDTLGDGQVKEILVQDLIQQ